MRLKFTESVLGLTIQVEGLELKLKTSSVLKGENIYTEVNRFIDYKRVGDTTLLYGLTDSQLAKINNRVRKFEEDVRDLQMGLLK